MKSLNLSQPQVMMVVGNPGAGKSFFARQFSDTFSAPVVSFDRIRFELFAKPTHSTDENDLVGRMATYQIGELLKTRRSFLVDGGCNSKTDRLKLAQVARQAEYGWVTIWVQTDINTCRTRALKRNPRRSDDQFNPSLPENIFDAQVKRFTTPDRENHIVISGKHTYNTQVKMVLRKLIATREADATAAHVAAKQTIQRPDTPRRGVIIR